MMLFLTCQLRRHQSSERYGLSRLSLQAPRRCIPCRKYPLRSSNVSVLKPSHTWLNLTRQPWSLSASVLLNAFQMSVTLFIQKNKSKSQELFTLGSTPCSERLRISHTNLRPKMSKRQWTNFFLKDRNRYPKHASIAIKVNKHSFNLFLLNLNLRGEKLLLHWRHYRLHLKLLGWASCPDWNGTTFQTVWWALKSNHLKSRRMQYRHRLPTNKRYTNQLRQNQLEWRLKHRLIHMRRSNKKKQLKQSKDKSPIECNLTLRIRNLAHKYNKNKNCYAQT